MPLKSRTVELLRNASAILMSMSVLLPSLLINQSSSSSVLFIFGWGFGGTLHVSPALEFWTTNALKQAHVQAVF
jgi:hypothetical protein